MKLLRSLAILSLIPAFLLTSCGEKGNTGDPGPQGPPGNANVITINFTINPNQWAASLPPPAAPGDEGYFLYYILGNVSEITQQIIDYGAVIAYYNDNGYYLPLPYTKYYKTTSPSIYLWEETLSSIISTATCQIDLKSSDFYIPEAASQQIRVKLVIIDGLVRQQNPDLDWNNYNLVKEKLGLED